MKTIDELLVDGKGVYEFKVPFEMDGKRYERVEIDSYKLTAKNYFDITKGDKTEDDIFFKTFLISAGLPDYAINYINIRDVYNVILMGNSVFNFSMSDSLLE